MRCKACDVILDDVETAKKDANLGTRDPSTELNNNSVIFQIKKDAVKKYDSIDEISQWNSFLVKSLNPLPLLQAYL